MRKQTLASFGLSLVLMLAAIFAVAVPASAKNDFGTRVKYNVPFDFYVGNKKMAAGEYEVERVSQTVYLIRNAEGKNGMLVASNVQTSDERRINTAKLVFNRYGQHNFLRRIYTQIRANGQLLNESKTERRIREERESEENLARKAEIIEITAE